MRTGSSKLKTSRQSLSAQLIDVSPHDLRHRFGYRMAERGPLHRLYIQGTKQYLQRAVETIGKLTEGWTDFARKGGNLI